MNRRNFIKGLVVFPIIPIVSKASNEKNSDEAEWNRGNKRRNESMDIDCYSLWEKHQLKCLASSLSIGFSELEEQLNDVSYNSFN